MIASQFRKPKELNKLLRHIVFLQRISRFGLLAQACWHGKIVEVVLSNIQRNPGLESALGLDIKTS